MTRFLFVFTPLLLISVAFAQDGPVGSWSFDEGRGEVVADLSGHGNTGKVHGASFITRGGGFALSFDGRDDYVDCGAGESLNLTEAITLEAWVKPTGLSRGEPMILGKFFDSYALTQYQGNKLWFYISGGGNKVWSQGVPLAQWQHVVATFDARSPAGAGQMKPYLNRRLVGAKTSPKDRIAPGKHFFLGALITDPGATDPGYPGTSFWQGELDDVRVYGRALSEAEIGERYRQTAGGYGVDTRWFDKLRLVAWPDAVGRQVTVLADASGIAPRPPETTLRLSLLAADESAAQPPREFSKLPPSGKVGCVVDLQGLARGRYRLAAELTVPGHEQVAAEQALTLPLAATPVPAPPRQVVPPLPAPPVAPKLTLTHELGGGFTVTVGGKPFRCGSSYSFPHGGENLLAPGAVCRTGEPEWRVSLKQLGHRRTIEAAGKYYRITRRCDLDGPIVRVFDEITNLTNEDLGLIIDHHLEVGDRPFRQRWVAGYPTALERTQPRSPSSFVAWADLGLGLLPLDDVSIVHSTCYARDDRVGFRDEMFGLAAGQSHVVEWQVHVVGPSPGRAGAGAAPPDYYSFINQVRAAEQRYQTVEGGFAFIPRDGITPEYAELRHLTYASFPCLGRSPDDPGSAVEGIDFLWLPKLRAQLTQQFAAIRQARPGLKLMFHIAHSLVSTCPAENRFPDSRVLDRDGKHVIYGYSYGPNGPFSPERHEAGWRWFIFYPTPGNSFHEALLQSADCLVDDIGCSGAFMDGFLGGYGSPWTYDRWDGHTVEMDPQTKTIKRKPASVLLLSQPSMAAFVRRMTARGAVVLANNVVMTRTMGKLPMIVDQEMTSGPDVDLAQTPCALGNYVNIKEEADVYLDALDKLRWGNLYFHYGEGKLTHPTLTAQQFPITVRQVSAGMIRGDERIITMHPGVYGWPGSRDLHRVYRYNEIGWAIAAGLVTTVDKAGVRTQVDLAADESAVVKHIPVQLQCAAAGNVMVTRYDSEAISLQINGRGKATLLVRNGDFAIAAEREYTVSVNTIERQVKADKDGVLRVPLTLTGPVSVTIAGG